MRDTSGPIRTGCGARPAAHALRPRTLCHGGADGNEIIVLEPERPGTELPLRDRPDLGRTTVVTLE
ncbi:hypothetical protein ACFV4Q_35075 [Streptomyces nojiriensis]|uniref:hypothetical protein n=1 Tax=Streptomyces nojiriensis TaxID=66374 RepID=UPI003662C5B9